MQRGEVPELEEVTYLIQEAETMGVAFPEVGTMELHLIQPDGSSTTGLMELPRQFDLQRRCTEQGCWDAKGARKCWHASCYQWVGCAS